MSHISLAAASRHTVYQVAGSVRSPYLGHLLRFSLFGSAATGAREVVDDALVAAIRGLQPR